MCGFLCFCVACNCFVSIRYLPIFLCFKVTRFWSRVGNDSRINSFNGNPGVVRRTTNMISKSENSEN